MAETQYAQFRDLDRHCVTGGMREPDCLAAVRRKRECILAPFNRENPVVREVLAGRTTFTAIYDGYSHDYRGIRRFLPMPHSAAHNQRLEHLGKILPNVRHFLRRSVFAIDNPVTCAGYGIIVAAACALVWAHASALDSENVGASRDLDRGAMIILATGFGLAGFLIGLFSVRKYRVRDAHRIHAREAAEYMDLNYTCHRTLDDEAWAKLVALRAAASTGSTPTAPISVPAASAPQRLPATN